MPKTLNQSHASHLTLFNAMTLAFIDNPAVQWLVGIRVTLALAAIGLILAQQNRKDDKLEKRLDKTDLEIGKIETEQHAARHAIRNEFTEMLARETVQRIQGDKDLDERFATNIDRVIDTMDNHHQETRADIRELRGIVLRDHERTES